MQIAQPHLAGAHSTQAMSALPPGQQLHAHPWLHGQEGVTKDAGGYVYWHGLEVEHFSYDHHQRRDEEAAARRIKATCAALEAAGRAVTFGVYLDWIRVLATVHFVNSASFTDVFGAAAFYRRAEPGAGLRVVRAAMAHRAIEEATGLTVLFDNQVHVDATAVVLVKVSEVASREAADAALQDLRQRFLGAFPDEGPRAVAALLKESRYEEGHYAGYIGVRLYTGAFEEPVCASVAKTLQVLREFARTCRRAGRPPCTAWPSPTCSSTCSPASPTRRHRAPSLPFPHRRYRSTSCSTRRSSCSSVAGRTASPACCTC